MEVARVFGRIARPGRDGHSREDGGTAAKLAGNWSHARIKRATSRRVLNIYGNEARRSHMARLSSDFLAAYKQVSDLIDSVGGGKR